MSFTVQHKYSYQISRNGTTMGTLHIILVFSNQSSQQRHEQTHMQMQCRSMQPIDSDAYWLSHARTSSADKV